MGVAAVELQKVCKDYGARRAVDSFSMTVAEGEVVALVGPNGAGKSTLLRLISGFCDPDRGRVRVLGRSFPEHRRELLRNIGYLPEGAPGYADMRVSEYLAFRARLKGVGLAAIAPLVEQVGLQERVRSKIGELSRGLRQRVGVADALLADPPVLLLDEPTTALDPIQIDEFRAFLLSQRDRRTVLVSSHAIADLGSVFRRVVVMVDGSLVADGNVEELRAQVPEADSQSLDTIVLALVRGERLDP